MKGFVPKYWKISTFGNKRSNFSVIAWFHECPWILSFGTALQHVCRISFQCQFCLCPVICPVLVWDLSASAIIFNANLGSFCLFKECVEPKYEVFGKDGLRPASKSTNQVILKSSQTSKLNPLFPSHFSLLQNKVLAVIEAIEAAQYLISHNATHLINQVKRCSLCLCS